MFIDIKYGLLSVIKVLKAPVVTEETCDNVFKGMITRQMYCLGNNNSCETPQGAPIDCNGELQGFFSWDYRSDCGLNKEGLGVFERICYFNDWIKSTMASN